MRPRALCRHRAESGAPRHRAEPRCALDPTGTTRAAAHKYSNAGQRLLAKLAFAPKQAIVVCLRSLTAESVVGGVLLLVLFAFGCGRVQASARDAGPQANGGAIATSGSALAGGGGAGPPVAGGAPNTSIPLDTSECAARPLADCSDVQTQYESNAGFERTQALAPCAAHNSFDGCATLLFEFDAQGCASSVGPGAAGWPAGDHLADLRECLTTAFEGARFPCLASQTLGYFESCFVY